MTTFNFGGTVALRLSAEEAWSLMTDVPKLVSWVDVLSDAHENEHLSSYTAVISDRVGMFSLHADLDIEVENAVAPTRLSFKATGKDRQLGSRISIATTVALSEDAEGCEVQVAGHYEITGRAATLGSSQITRKGEKVLHEFFENLRAEAPPPAAD